MAVRTCQRMDGPEPEVPLPPTVLSSKWGSSVAPRYLCHVGNRFGKSDCNEQRFSLQGLPERVR